MESSTLNTIVSVVVLSVVLFSIVHDAAGIMESPTVYDDLLLSDEDQLCNEYSKECHCGSIANGPNISLFTRIVYPNSSIKIEEYDENVPYGYKYLSVYYRCIDDEDVLVGNNMRKCNEGNWIGPVPRCAINLRNQTKLKKVKISDFKYRLLNQSGLARNSSDRPMSATTLDYDQDLVLNPNGTFEIPLGSQPSECPRWSLSPNQIWSLTLDRPTRVHYVRIKLFGDKIEDLYLSREIAFDMFLRNITYLEPMGMSSPNVHNNQSNSQNNANIHSQNREEVNQLSDVRCSETIPKASQYSDSAQQKYSANYLVLDFLCEVENSHKTFEYLFPEDYEVDQLMTSVIDVHFRMLKLKLPYETASRAAAIVSAKTVPGSINTGSSSVDINVPQSDQPQSIAKNDFTSIESRSRKVDAPIEISTTPKPVVSTTPQASEIGSRTELEFKQKIFVTSLCELKLYSFQVDCGFPDFPVTAVVIREFNFLEESERQTFKFTCPEKNRELKGNSYIECGSYGRWKHDFPQCVRIRPCKLLTSRPNSDTELVVHYEMRALTKSGKQVVPNDKWARFACMKRKNVEQTVVAQAQKHHHYTQIICRNGKWIGLDLSVNSACIDLAKLNIFDKNSNEAANITGRDSSNNVKDLANAGGLVSLPVRLIRILSLLFVALCLIIICLLVYMILFRRRMLKANSVKAVRNYYTGQDIPTILFDSEPGHETIYAEPSDNNLYESIPEETHSHLYQRTTDNYSDVSSWTPQLSKGEERENSIYGFEDDDNADDDSLVGISNKVNIDSDESTDEDGVVRITDTNQLSIGNGYNQLSRSSSMFMKANSIYES